jgi:hypothetical protein
MRSESKQEREDEEEAKSSRIDDAKHSEEKDIEMKDSTQEEIVNKVIKFFFDDDEFASTFEKFAEKHCHVFDVESEEMKLE